MTEIPKGGGFDMSNSLQTYLLMSLLSRKTRNAQRLWLDRSIRLLTAASENSRDLPCVSRTERPYYRFPLKAPNHLTQCRSILVAVGLQAEFSKCLPTVLFQKPLKKA